MEYTTLGNTGLRVSVLGLGGGGHSRLGTRHDASAAESIRIVQQAVERGVNFIDTAEAYGTEALIGDALQGIRRENFVLSTKKSLHEHDQFIDADALRRGLDASLRRLRTDYVDVYHLHGVRAAQYDRAVEELVPALERERDAGRIRFLGITEAFGVDPGHQMLARAVEDGPWDVVMVGHNILNQSARERVLATTMRRGIGTLCMFAVRDALSQPAKLRETVAQLVSDGLLEPDALDPADPLGFLLRDGVARSIPEAAYRFCRAEPGIDVVLSGTGNIAHLHENIDAITAPPLPSDVRQRLIEVFKKVDTVSGQ
jgi:L-galactose dehydrogenase